MVICDPTDTGYEASAAQRHREADTGISPRHAVKLVGVPCSAQHCSHTFAERCVMAAFMQVRQSQRLAVPRVPLQLSVSGCVVRAIGW